MNIIKKLWEKIKSPSVAYGIGGSILSLLIIAGTVTLVVLGLTESVFVYLLYALSATALAYLVWMAICFVPRIKGLVILQLKKHKFTNELLDSYGYRSIIFAVWSFIVNVAYAIFQGVMAILSRSVWLGSLSVYYLVISLIRGGIVAISRKREETFTRERQIRAYRNCGIYLVLLNFALTGAVVQMVAYGGGFKYAGNMIYVMAVYAFYKLGMGIYNIFKAKKCDDYTIQSIKNISFADALVSILGLQTALLYAFSENYQPLVPNALTGGVVSVLIIAMGIYMIVRGQKELKKIKEVEDCGQ